jgi:hypothetical protein
MSDDEHAHAATTTHAASSPRKGAGKRKERDHEDEVREPL